MNIGILVYSYTGNTLSVAERLKSSLENKGQSVTLMSLKATDENPNQTKIDLISIPDLSSYDRIILASPVRGFQVSPIMKAYLQQTSPLKDKPVACFVTHAFPFAWLGGKTAIKMMTELVNAKQAKVVLTGIINWGNRKRETEIIALLDRFSDEASWNRS
jgi:menaquinone-dependent protoporphyrinogen IX oxidase